MYEFDSVSVSSYEATSLAAKLTEKSGDGWEVVSIVSAGSDVVAYLKKSSGAAAATTVDTAATTSDDSGAVATPTEPAGWGSAPTETTPASGDSGWGSTAAAAGTGAAAGSSWGSGATDTGSSWGSTAAAAPAAAAAAQSSTPSVPPGWYADPAGRYELRYWDGSAWTEHVSRAGQQYTDPPVA